MTTANSARHLALPAAVLLVVASACTPEEGPLMDPGEDCLECHGAGEGPGWNAAGTWAREGQTVWIRDANGKSFTLRTNQVGNFYTAESLAYPIRVAVDGEEMEDDVPNPIEAGAAGFCIDHEGEQRCCEGARCGCNDCHARGED